MTDPLWSMPGPERFVQDALDLLLRQGCLVVELPERVRPGFARALEREAQAEDVCVLRRLDAQLEPASNPGRAIARHGLPPGISPGVNTARDLPQNPDLEDEVLLVESLSASGWRDWDVFLRAFQRAQQESPLASPYAIAVCVPPGTAASSRAFTVLRWEGPLRRADTALFVAEAINGRPPSAVDPRLLEATIVELSGWNLDLARRMSELPTETLLDPLAWLESKTELAPGAPSEVWDGDAFTCSLELARRADRQALRRRLWRAHLATVFPAIEEVRIEAVRRHDARLRRELPSPTPWGGTVDDPYDLELGHLLHLIGRCLPQDEGRYLGMCKRIRDRMAHRDPVDPDAIDAFYRHGAGKPGA